MVTIRTQLLEEEWQFFWIYKHNNYRKTSFQTMKAYGVTFIEIASMKGSTGVKWVILG